MRFIIYLRKGYTSPFYSSLREAGRLDVLYQVALSTFFVSGALRRNNDLHAFLYGPKNPPLHIEIKGEELYDVRTDEETWKEILRNVLKGKPHPGIYVEKEGIENFLRKINGEKYVLREDGEPIEKIVLSEDSWFLLGDHIGLPKKLEEFAINNGFKKISIGKVSYLAYQVVSIINYLWDKQWNS